MRDSGGEQADGGEFFRLQKLVLQSNLHGYVVQDNDAAGDLIHPIHHRDHAQVHDQVFAATILEVHFKNVARALQLPPLRPRYLLHRGYDIRQEEGLYPGTQDLFPMDGIQLFECTVARPDSPLEVQHQDRNIDVLDYVLGVDFQPLELESLDLHRAVKIGILERNRRQRAQQIKILCGQVLVTGRMPQPDHPDSPSAEMELLQVMNPHTGETWMGSIQSYVRLPIGETVAHSPVEELVLAEKQRLTQIGDLQADLVGQAAATGPVGIGNEQGRLLHLESLRHALEYTSGEASETYLGGESARELEQTCAVIELILVEESVEASLNPVANGREKKGNRKGRDANHHKICLRCYPFQGASQHKHKKQVHRQQEGTRKEIGCSPPDYKLHVR